MKTVLWSCALLLSAGMLTGSALAAEEAKTPEPAAVEKEVDPATCYSCHDTIKKLHADGKHAKVNCVNCHSGLEKHLKEGPSPETRPVTAVSWENCGKCHQDQYQSFMKEALHRPARDEKSQLDNRSPNPFWDKLMAGHGFTKEHNATRSHKWMLIDHLVVDRAYGGRFQGKNGWQYLLESGKRSDVLKDMYPDNNEHKAFLPQSGPAANPVCMQCKSQDNILGWAYLGDKTQGTTFSRESNVVDLARATEQGLNCFYCHDPHAAKPRIVRDGLIAALTRPEADTLWHKDPNRTKFEVVDMGLRGFPRKIALLEKYDSRLLCGQCHVEYNCNSGKDSKTGEPITYADRRTNHFPFKDVFGLYEHYKNLGFLDFQHALTGGMLWKAQHPEAETFYNSKHAQAGVSCFDCHTPKVKNSEGKTYTSHFATTPKLQLKETCLQCHGDKWNEEKATYVINSIRAYGKGKMRKAEYWLSALIDKIVAAKKAGVAEDIVKQAQDQHLKAHILWEYWTAENSDGFHNPEMARESLTRSVDESQKGINLLKEAMGEAQPAAKK